MAAVNNRIGNLESQLRKQGNTLNQVDEAMGKVRKMNTLLILIININIIITWPYVDL